jgi:hypothetical protein
MRLLILCNVDLVLQGRIICMTSLNVYVLVCFLLETEKKNPSMDMHAIWRRRSRVARKYKEIHSLAGSMGHENENGGSN